MLWFTLQLVDFMAYITLQKQPFKIPMGKILIGRDFMESLSFFTFDVDGQISCCWNLISETPGFMSALHINSN